LALAPSAPIPLFDPISNPKRTKYGERERDPQDSLVTLAWNKFFVNLNDQVAAAATVLATTSLTGQAASIGATALDLGSVSAGLYRVTYYTRITQAATTSSSLTVSFAWTDTASMSTSFAAITGNSITTFQSDSLMVYIDNASPITYSTTYASTGATPMQYSLRITTERMST